MELTVKQWLSWYREKLAGTYENKEIRAVFMLLLEEVCGVPRHYAIGHPEYLTGPEADKCLEEALTRLEKNEPIQYIIGYTEFLGLKIGVNKNVLIPRPETEEMVEWSIKVIKESALLPSRILDIGTGSGCIALSLKAAFPNAEVFGIDINPDAIELARDNALRLSLSVDFEMGDVMMEENMKIIKDTDIIISNPPYILPAEKESLPSNVLNFEPHNALFVNGDDPLQFVKIIARLALMKLNQDGWIFLENNSLLAGQVKNYFEIERFSEVSLKHDMSGKPRFIACRRPLTI